MTESKAKEENPKPVAPTPATSQTAPPTQAKPANGKKTCIIVAIILVFLLVLFMFVIPAILTRVDASINSMIGKSKTPTASTGTKTATAAKKRSSSEDSSSAPSSAGVPDCTQVTVNDPPYPNLDKSNPGVHESTKYYSYTVYGNTSDEIIGQEVKCGPSWDGSSSDVSGLAYYNLRWDYDYAFPDADPASRTCAIKNLVVGLTVDIYLPHWDNVANAPQKTIDYWDTELPRITNHENTHRQNDINGSNEVYNAILPLVGSDCPDLENKIQQATDPVLEHLDQINHELDARENH